MTPCIVCGAPAEGWAREVFCSIPCGLEYVYGDQEGEDEE